ncbi:MAG: ATP-binding protein [Sandaracinaceae bacterium]|nr:ATP-binding protein [Sandaracinaceae bacterium]
MLVRHLEPVVDTDLSTKMVFVAGPRQCGKTTLAQQLLERRGGAYFSYDVPEHRKTLRDGALPEDAGLWVFDELHKLRTWRRWLKGVCDLHGRRHPILVTGSARLDAYNRSGESLQGRYFLHRMHPLTFSELAQLPPHDALDAIVAIERPAPAGGAEHLDALLRLGPFPEPLLGGSERRAARWRLGYGARLVREELRDLEDFRDLDRLELLFDRLPDTVGSLLSINALREDLEVAFETVRAWLSALERLYAIFRATPLGPPRIKAVKKASKLYLWDWARVDDPAARAENLVVSHLLRLVHWIEDVHGERAELRFFRSIAGHEVDAVVLRKGKPWLAVEVKLEEGPLDRGLRYLLERVPIPHAFQVHLHGATDRVVPDVGRGGVRILPAARLLANLP